MEAITVLNKSQAQTRIAELPGLIPVAVDATRHLVQWLDLGEYHCYEGFFQQSLATWTALCKTRPDSFFSGLDSLGELHPDDCIRPSGFIFHAGRCGSTLLTKVLARSRANLLMSEAPAHNQIWRVLSKSSAEDELLYRQLLLATGRRRLKSHTAYIVKFTSFNIVNFDFIRAAFPEVPALFLFRDPATVLSSCRKQAPGWLGRNLGPGLCWEQPEKAVEEFFATASRIRDPYFRCLDYAALTPEMIPEILRFFGIRHDASLPLMLSEFQWDSKKSGTRRPFAPAGTANTQPTADSLKRLHEKLKEHAAGCWEP